MDDREFLKSFALARFNQQYKRNFKTIDCDIKSLPVRYDSDRSYEVFSNRLDDYFRLHMHLRFDNRDGLGDYRVELQGPRVTDGLGDEVLVAVGTIDRYYVEAGLTRFRNLNTNGDLVEVLIYENGDPIPMNNGELILLASGV